MLSMNFTLLALISLIFGANVRNMNMLKNFVLLSSKEINYASLILICTRLIRELHAGGLAVHYG